MKWILIAAGAIVLFVVFRLRNGPIVAQQDQVTIDQIPDIYQALKSTGSDGSFAVLIPSPLPGDEEAVNIQFSIENGSIGLDWVLLSPVNIRDKEQFVALLKSHRASHREIESNGCVYIRTEDRQAPLICQKVLEEMYGVTGKIGVDLIVESFTWSQADG